MAKLWYVNETISVIKADLFHLDNVVNLLIDEDIPLADHPVLLEDAENIVNHVRALIAHLNAPVPRMGNRRRPLA